MQNKQKIDNLIVRLGEVVQGHDVIQERTKLGGEVLQHESVVVSFL